VVYAVQILSVLPRVVQSFASDLRKLTGSIETRGSKGVNRASVNTPVC
jgi:hypothetical protein